MKQVILTMALFAVIVSTGGCGLMFDSMVLGAMECHYGMKNCSKKHVPVSAPHDKEAPPAP